MNTKYSRQDLWSKFFEIGPAVNRDTAVNKIAQTLSVKPSEVLNDVVSRELKRYKEKLQPKKKMCPTVPKDFLLFEDVMLEPEDPVEEMETEETETSQCSKSPPTSQRKPFLHPSNRAKRTRTDDIDKLLKEFVNDQNNKFPDSPLTVTNLLGYLLYRNNYHNDKVMAATGTKVRFIELVY